MDNDAPRRSLSKVVAAGAVAVGLAAGSYGVASAASASGSSTAASGSAGAAAAPSAPDPQNPWGGQRSDETLLTGDTASKVKAAALAKVDGATIVRVETDADGNAAYEAHMVKADGTPVTVFVNQQFEVVSVESRWAGSRRETGLATSGIRRAVSLIRQSHFPTRSGLRALVPGTRDRRSSSETKGVPMSNLASVHRAPSVRLSYAAAMFAVGSVVVWVLAGVVDDGLYVFTGVLGIVAFGLGLKARRDARRAGSNGRLALAAMIVGGLLGAAVIAALITYGVSHLV